MSADPLPFEVSNTEKIMFPEEGITKGAVIEYYQKIADHLLPQARDRPLAMYRFPDGLSGEHFFQKEAPDYFPEWIPTVTVKKVEGGEVKMVLCNDAATLAYLANQACLEWHVWLSRAGNLENPDKMVFDLDPPPGGFSLVTEGAALLRRILEDEYGLRPFVMTTGSKGMHVVVPLLATSSFAVVRERARGICRRLAEAGPGKFTTEVRKDKRQGRLFLDYLRNSYGQHSIAPYSLRARPGAPVATPLDWQEIDDLENGAQTYTLQNIFRRLGQKEDPWQNFLQYAKSL